MASKIRVVATLNGSDTALIQTRAIYIYMALIQTVASASQTRVAPIQNRAGMVPPLLNILRLALGPAY